MEMKIFISLFASSNIVRFNIASCGIILVFSLIEESIKLNPTISKEDILTIHYWYKATALTIYSSCQAFSFDIFCDMFHQNAILLQLK